MLVLKKCYKNLKSAYKKIQQVYQYLRSVFNVFGTPYSTTGYLQSLFCKIFGKIIICFGVEFSRWGKTKFIQNIEFSKLSSYPNLQLM